MRSSSSSLDNWGREVRAFTDLLARIRAGWRYEFCEAWEVNESTGWCQYWLTEPDGTRHPVRTSVAIAAWRKGWAKPEKREEPPHPTSCRCRDCADARGDWEMHCRQNDRGPP